MHISNIFLALFLAAIGVSAHASDPVRMSPGKPLHPIQVSAVVDGELKAGVEVPAKIIVSTRQPAESIEVILEPKLATVLSASRFERRDNALHRGKVELPFSLQPASDAPQPVSVLVRVTRPDGSVMTRETTLALGATPREKAPPENVIVPQEKRGQPPADRVLPAEQEIIRD